MRKILLTLFLSAIAAQFISAQNCKRDSSILKIDTVFISPKPTPPGSTAPTLLPACINQPYEQSITIKVPETFTFQGITLPLTNASIATTGAIINLPSGLTYKCDPPNCVFPAKTLGCVLIYGTPNKPSEAPKVFEPSINATVQTSFGPIAITFPGPIAPGKYYMELRAAGNCVSSAYDFGSPISSVKNTPNPFSGQTLIELESAKSGEFLFEVFNAVGQRIHHQQIQIVEGPNQFTFDAGDLDTGMYYYQIGNADGKVSRTLSVVK